MTNPLNMEYALSQAVQKVEGGDSMVNMTVWHETHYFYPLGTVSVTKVRGDIISLKNDSQVPLFEDPANSKKPLPSKKGSVK
jgi:hypothetical protein